MATRKSTAPPSLSGAVPSCSELRLLLLRLEGVLAVLTLAHEALLRQAADFDLEVALALRLFAMKPLGEVVDRLRPLLGDQVRGPGPSL